MHPQDIHPALIERNIRRAHLLRSQAILAAFATLPRTLGRMARGIVAFAG